MLLVVPVALAVAVRVLLSAVMRLHFIPVNKCHSSLGIIQGLEVVIAVTADDVALWHHLQVGSDAVVAGTGVITEVDDTAFIDALIRWLNPGEAEFMGDVASYNLHDLAKADNIKRENIKNVVIFNKESQQIQTCVTLAEQLLLWLQVANTE